MAKFTEAEPKAERTEEMFNDFLDESFDEITILGLRYSPSVVLRECDPIAYRIYSQDFID
jgi:hypothetical protein